MASKKEVVYTDKVKVPVNPPPFCLATKCNGMVYCSGSVGTDSSGKLVEGDVKARTTATLTNMKNILEAAGSGLGNVVKANVYLTTMDNFAAMNEAYLAFFKEHSPDYIPARTCVAVYQLPLGADVEIECTAHQ